MAKLIIGLTGPIASGKGTVKEYVVKKYGASDCRFSTILRDILKRVDLEIVRENLQKISLALRQTFGEDLLSRAIAKDAVNLKEDIVVIDGIRRMTDIGHLIKLPHFVLVSIDAAPETRHGRLVLRGENADDKTKTFEAFINDHKAETEITIPEVMSYAKEKLDNNGNQEDLFKQIDQIVEKYL